MFVLLLWKRNLKKNLRLIQNFYQSYTAQHQRVLHYSHRTFYTSQSQPYSRISQSKNKQFVRDIKNHPYNENMSHIESVSWDMYLDSLRMNSLETVRKDVLHFNNVRNENLWLNSLFSGLDISLTVKKRLLLNCLRMESQISEGFVRLVELIWARGQFHNFFKIFDTFDKLVQVEQGNIKIQVRSPLRLTDSQLQRLHLKFKTDYFAGFPQHVGFDFENIVDQNMSGGLIIHFANRKIEMSKENELRKIVALVKKIL